MKIAIISDVHGNSLALQKVLGAIKENQVDYIVNLGDCLFGPLDPAGTAEILINLNIPTVCGNQDRELYESDTGSETLDYVKSQLSESHMSWIKNLTMIEFFLDDFLLCHGTPFNDIDYLLYDVTPQGAVARTNQGLQELLRGIERKYIFCGHNHLAGVKELEDGRVIINAGAVGIQAYDDDVPYYHIMQSGTPQAHYTLFELNGDSWSANDIAVDYDYESAAKLAEKNNRSDWAHWLRTGRVIL